MIPVTVSVAHYGEQNSDLMRDPEMLFEVVETAGSVSFRPFYFRNDYIGIEQRSRYRDDSGTVVRNLRLTRELEAFAAMWDRNLGAHGFLRAFRQQPCGQDAKTGGLNASLAAEPPRGPPACAATTTAKAVASS